MDKSSSGQSKSTSLSEPNPPATTRMTSEDIAISIGSHRLKPYVELNLASCRSVFGPDAPIIVVDGKSQESGAISRIASMYSADFISDDGKYGHFAGDIANTACGLRYAEQVGAKLYIKLNQRFILTHKCIPSRICSIFNDNGVDIALPGRAKRGRAEKAPAFYFMFPHLVDVLFIRVGSISPDEIISAYQNQCKNAKNRDQLLVEYFWDEMCNRRFLRKSYTLDWLTNHHAGYPRMYLRKIQNKASDYKEEAMKLGLSSSLDFDTREWGTIKGKDAYRPAPKFI